MYSMFVPTTVSLRKAAMSKTFPFESSQDQIDRSPIRQPLKVNRRAEDALRELQLEQHQDFEIEELNRAVQASKDSEEDIT